MNTPTIPNFVADIIVERTPPPILQKSAGSSPASLPSLAFWAMAVVAALILWRMRRRRALIDNRASSAPTPSPQPAPAGPE